MTIKEARFLATSFKAFCADFDHIPAEFPNTVTKAAEAIKANPARFVRRVSALQREALYHHRHQPTYEAEFETLEELLFLANNPHDCMYYFWEDAAFKTVREFVHSQLEAKKAGHPLHY